MWWCLMQVETLVIDECGSSLWEFNLRDILRWCELMQNYQVQFLLKILFFYHNNKTYCYYYVFDHFAVYLCMYVIHILVPALICIMSCSQQYMLCHLLWYLCRLSDTSWAFPLSVYGVLSLQQVSDPGQFVDLLYCRRLRSAALRQQVNQCGVLDLIL